MSDYSKMLGWEVYNFMSIGHGKCSFDDKGIINFKGYNDSGKSAMLTALRVLCTNFQASKQASFIRDDCDYFRVIAYFDDGVKIMRDKYVTGQSLYEMYKGDDLLFTTKSSTGVLTRVQGVPEPVQQYLALIDSDDTYLNFRSCFEKQIGVQTSGSENYKVFNNVLKSEEIASASALLNTDKNKLVSDISDTENQLNAAKTLLGNTAGITKEMVDFLKALDVDVDALEEKSSFISEVKEKKDELASVVVAPVLFEINTVDTLVGLFDVNEQIRGISVAPKLAEIDSVDLLQSIVAVKADIHEIQPELREISSIDTLVQMKSILTEYSSIDIKSIDEDIKKAQEELEELSHTSGIKVQKCPNCGEVIVVEG